MIKILFQLRLVVTTCVALASLVMADFQLYTYYDRDTLLATYGVTDSCLDAL